MHGLEHGRPGQPICSSTCIRHAGLNIATLEDATPGRRLDSDDPSAAEAALFVDRAMSEGAIGIKLLGGPLPFDPRRLGAHRPRCAETRRLCRMARGDDGTRFQY